jgi:hypothetical protein
MVAPQGTRNANDGYWREDGLWELVNILGRRWLLEALPLGFERALQQLTDRNAPRRDFALSPAPVFKRFKDGPKAQLDRCVIRGLLEITHVSLAAIAVQRGNNPKLENP